MAFKCRPDCGECCRITPIPKSLYEKFLKRVCHRVIEVKTFDFSDLVKKHRFFTEPLFIAPITVDGWCCFLNAENKCAVYKDRPVQCREYGKTPDMQCPYISPHGIKRTLKEQQQVEAMNIAINDAKWAEIEAYNVEEK